MIVKAYYAGGRIDVFDTDRMTDGVPQPGNLLTNYTLDLAAVSYTHLDVYKRQSQGGLAPPPPARPNPRVGRSLLFHLRERNRP